MFAKSIAVEEINIFRIFPIASLLTDNMIAIFCKHLRFLQTCLQNSVNITIFMITIMLLHVAQPGKTTANCNISNPLNNNLLSKPH